MLESKSSIRRFWTKVKAVCMGCCAVFLVAAEATAAPTPVQRLSNSSWRLVEIQSMDDAQGIKRPVDRTKYTLTLSANGKLSMKLDCNQYQGKWLAKPSADVNSGSLELNPVMGTKVACPSPSFGPQLASQTEHVRSYLLKDDRLFLSLKADGGIWVWEPLTQYNNQPNRLIEAAILKQNPDYSKSKRLEGALEPARYIYNQLDLNGDGRNETLVYLLGPEFCGTGGCNLLVLNAQYQVMGDFSLVSVPVQVSNQSHKGWKQLSWSQSGGGSTSAKTVYAQVSGKAYALGSGSPRLSGEAYLQGFREFQQGAVLQPLP